MKRKILSTLGLVGVATAMFAACSSSPSSTIDPAPTVDASVPATDSGPRPTTDSAAPTTDAATEASVNPCPGATLCSARCVDTSIDRANCGSCGNACAAGQVCTNGACGVTCPGGQTNCNGTCRATTTDNENCGACGTVCPAGSVCSSGTCTTTCASNLNLCTPGGGSGDAGAGEGGVSDAGDAGRTDAASDAGAPARPYCANFLTDRANCGGCGTTCATGQVCVNRSCQLSCAAGTIVCNGACINPQTDRSNCGASGNCQNTNAGTACTAGQVCSNGACAVSCQNGLLNCNGTCTDPQTNPNFCGATGNCQGQNAGTACTSLQACVAGTCRTLSCANSSECPNTSSLCIANLCKVPRDCAEIKTARPSATDGTYTIDPDGNGPIAAFSAYCDMTTAGGGWTIVSSFAGADNEQPLVSNTEVAGNALAFAAYNVNRAKKIALSAISNESILKRSTGVFVRADKALFDNNLDTPNSQRKVATNLVSSDNVRAAAFMGYANFNITGGGDFGLSLNPDGTTCGNSFTTASGFDNHSTSYWQLNCACERQYFYSYSAVTGDSDGSYKANTGLGAWSVTATCASTEGGGMAFFAAMRRTYTSCSAIRDAFPNVNLPSGNYVIDADGAGAEPAFPVYCDMSTGGGGWTLLMGATATGTNFGNNNANWSTNNTIGTVPSTLPIQADFKSSAYNTLTTNEIRLCYQDTTRCHVFTHNGARTLLGFFTQNVSYTEYSNDIWGYANAGTVQNRTNYLTNLGLPTTAPGNCHWLGINHKETATNGVTTQGFSGIGLMGDGNCGCQTYYNNDLACASGGNNWIDDYALGLGLQSCSDANGCPHGGSGHTNGMTQSASGLSGNAGPWMVFGR